MYGFVCIIAFFEIYLLIDALFKKGISNTVIRILADLVVTYALVVFTGWLYGTGILGLLIVIVALAWLGHIEYKAFKTK